MMARSNSQPSPQKNRTPTTWQTSSPHAINKDQQHSQQHNATKKRIPPNQYQSSPNVVVEAPRSPSSPNAVVGDPQGKKQLRSRHSCRRPTLNLQTLNFKLRTPNQHKSNTEAPTSLGSLFQQSGRGRGVRVKTKPRHWLPQPPRKQNICHDIRSNP